MTTATRKRKWIARVMPWRRHCSIYADVLIFKDGDFGMVCDGHTNFATFEEALAALERSYGSVGITGHSVEALGQAIAYGTSLSVAGVSVRILEYPHRLLSDGDTRNPSYRPLPEDVRSADSRVNACRVYK